jgi:RNA polymerase sigma factor (sigma-70 family)
MAAVSICINVNAIIDGALVAGTVASAAAGDEAAFARIIATHDDDLVRVAYLVTDDVDLAHEAAQAAWLIAWRKLGSLRDEDRLRPWLVAIAANEARQLLRRRRRRSVVEITIASMPEAAAEQVGSRTLDAWLDLHNALRRLSPEDRSIVAMRYALGLTSSEIASVTGLSATGVRSRLARSLARLRKDLDDV